MQLQVAVSIYAVVQKWGAKRTEHVFIDVSATWNLSLRLKQHAPIVLYLYSTEKKVGFQLGPARNSVSRCSLKRNTRHLFVHLLIRLFCTPHLWPSLMALTAATHVVHLSMQLTSRIKREFTRLVPSDRCIPTASAVVIQLHHQTHSTHHLIYHGYIMCRYNHLTVYCRCFRNTHRKKDLR